MKDTISAIIFSLTLLTASGQNRELNFLNGYWIAEEYSNSFDKTKSAIVSKNAFDGTDPVAFRISFSDSFPNILEVDHYSLHHHLICSEMKDGKHMNLHSDFFYNYFTVDLTRLDSLKSHPTSYIYQFSDDNEASFSWAVIPDTVVILHRPAEGKVPSRTIRYRKKKFSINLKGQFPNPLYCYIRSVTLAGTYTLTDGAGKVLSKRFTIKQDGSNSGYSGFSGKRFYFSTDIYCGEESFFDVVIICTNANEDFDCDNWIYLRKSDRIIEFHESDYSNQTGVRTMGKLQYKLVKK